MSEELDLLDLADLHLLQNIDNSPQDLEASNLNFFQLNQRRSEIVDQCTRNFALRHNSHQHRSPLICLLQEPYYYKKGTFYGPDHTYEVIYLAQPGKRARAAIWCPKIFNPRPVHQIMSEDIAAAAISFNNNSFLIVSIYNPPNGDPSYLLSKIEGNFSSKHLHSVILGVTSTAKATFGGQQTQSTPKHSRVFFSKTILHVSILQTMIQPSLVARGPLTLTPPLSPHLCLTKYSIGNCSL